ncbi:hypothetical protein LAV84_28615 [Rhizobium sp. VS19-DR104.2]|uniref:hypothetical protein n=1 Tax=unclassified Rhizobium TaxID=2613769 RepID=UPI001C5AC985|nr:MULTISPECIES: hypothetical protein [unclassified Rhizobium]MBZ5763463.1 hypothetical protein [Rhizobium sp. VS19-DR96]MBZ5769402.1 hypothetical protein [Rhizobium sp. VS19-DR129.2]MBZ5777209.1 hypothetical protein [Rhizobium sp. VS19-DRK62.2]MBZ5788024.1 hypothetical protein [Rhizobium sp. VS19-DR121]MBZ5805515.1 hypothetical protein [Rhizobium sp. VS19-DR181]
MKFVHSRTDLPSEDLASGKVLFSRPGLTAFPVRPASELFLRATSLLRREGRTSPYHLYDPTCGGGYLATVLGFLHGDQLRNISMSDVSAYAVSVAGKNAALLTEEGLSERLSELSHFVALHNRQSHRAAVESANRLFDLHGHLSTHVIQADATDAELLALKLANLPPVDLVVADAPYGKQEYWRNGAHEAALLASLASINVPVVILATAKGIKFDHPGFGRAGKYHHGHRTLWLFRNSNLAVDTAIS